MDVLTHSNWHLYFLVRCRSDISTVLTCFAHCKKHCLPSPVTERREEQKQSKSQAVDFGQRETNIYTWISQNCSYLIQAFYNLSQKTKFDVPLLSLQSKHTYIFHIIWVLIFCAQIKFLQAKFNVPQGNNYDSISWPKLSKSEVTIFYCNLMQTIFPGHAKITRILLSNRLYFPGPFCSSSRQRDMVRVGD